ncbi:OLC1v1025137C1 [Oldenlandia corymbosa var. corymbosa]|uniref:OLC1v1025137C1 n=1 Tax=Oldenlandia corymbosa var. corymbosa TaxID=529605 RepID=A0AAV1C417_OLDCO|nr:OLC1v1025137C1 [Oldenlandia corymbosa var. corymbosa]
MSYIFITQIISKSPIQQTTKNQTEKKKPKISKIQITISSLFISSTEKKPEKRKKKKKMSSTRRAWIAAVTVGAVQGLKDQGLCRWKNGSSSIRSAVQQFAHKNLVAGAAAPCIFPSNSPSASVTNWKDGEQLRVSEESLRKVMYLSCWGPN